jgi:hypothetical protein
MADQTDTLAELETLAARAAEYAEAHDEELELLHLDHWPDELSDLIYALQPSDVVDLLKQARLAATLASILCTGEGQDPIERAKELRALACEWLIKSYVETADSLRAALTAKDAEFDNAWRSIPPHDMVLHCPNCGKQHLDIGEFATRVHRKHLCENTTEGPSTGCGHLWVPFPYATRGVEQTKDATIDEMLEVFSTNPEEYRADPVGAMRGIEERLRRGHKELARMKERVAELEQSNKSAVSAAWNAGFGAATGDGTP